MLIDNYRRVSYYFGSLMLTLCGLILTPLLYLLFDSSEWSDAGAFVLPAFICLLLYGVFGYMIGRKTSKAMNYGEAAVAITITWLVMCVISGIPLMRLSHMNFTQAFFEAMSGFTTTGLSVLDFQAGTQMIYLWRAIMQFAGGAGIAIFLIALANAPYGSGLTQAEGKSDQLVPQIRHSARLVVYIYGSYLLVGTIAYVIAGMNGFDALIHAMAALSTGGFSNHYESIAWYKSVPIEAVSIVLMLLGNLNFLNAYILFKGKVGSFLRNGETKVQMIIIPLATAALMTFLTVGLYGSVSKGFRIGLFEVVSSLTTTGFTSTVYTHWSEFGLLILTILMLIGGGSNSTAGGLKQYRVYFLYKAIIQQLKEMTSSHLRVVRLTFDWGDGKGVFTSKIISSLFLFLVLYFGIYVIGVVLMVAAGYSYLNASFEFASALSNSGLSVGVTSAGMPAWILWLLSFSMYLGRLEIIIVFVAIGQIVRDFQRAFHTLQ